MTPWAEYDAAAEQCATQGTTWRDGDLLPPVSQEVRDLIDEDPDAFEARVAATAYAVAMRRATR